jgi:DNA recombination protein RmuC
MLSVQVVMSLLRDVRMREQAHVIQQEVVKLLEDVSRLDDRVRRLQTHFAQANKDIEDIAVSSRKIVKRGSDITDVEIEPDSPAAKRPAPANSDGPPELPFQRYGES